MNRSLLMEQNRLWNSSLNSSVWVLELYPSKANSQPSMLRPEKKDHRMGFTKESIVTCTCLSSLRKLLHWDHSGFFNLFKSKNFNDTSFKIFLFFLTPILIYNTHILQEHVQYLVNENRSDMWFWSLIFILQQLIWFQEYSNRLINTCWIKLKNISLV